MADKTEFIRTTATAVSAHYLERYTPREAACKAREYAEILWDDIAAKHGFHQDDFDCGYKKGYGEGLHAGRADREAVDEAEYHRAVKAARVEGGCCE